MILFFRAYPFDILILPKKGLESVLRRLGDVLLSYSGRRIEFVVEDVVVASISYQFVTSLRPTLKQSRHTACSITKVSMTGLFLQIFRNFPQHLSFMKTCWHCFSILESIVKFGHSYITDLHLFSAS